VDLGAVAAGNDEFLQLLAKIAKIATFFPLCPATFIGTSQIFCGR